jgi:bla regulator protein BlaR1
MIPNHLSANWAALAPALGNHVWQSTLFAIAAGLLTLILRKNHARARYWLWLAASVKFLIPFSLLVGIGSRLAWSHASAGTNAGLYFAMDEVSQPFTQPILSVISPPTAATISSTLIQVLPALLAAAWLCGFLVVLFVWLLRWRRISAAVRVAAPLLEGREVEMLRRLERIGGSKRIEMLLSRTSLEPGIFGIARPVLVWPMGISDRLEDSHLEAILAHEVWHVRRCDNLAAALHMLVESIFWFHPLVWWLGARLVEERERACDEAVLESGSDRQVYAESILKICEFCVGSPLACVSGVTGADLKRRIARIMTEGTMRKLNFSKKLLLSAAGLLAVAAPIVFGLLHATQTRAATQARNAVTSAPVFETSSITPNKNGEPMAGFKIIGRPAVAIMWRPNQFMATNFSLRMLLMRAYDVQNDQISGGPSWLDSEKYDVLAKLDKSTADELPKLSPDQGILERQGLLQTLLSDRFKLTLHRETKELPVYSLVIANDGPKIQQAKPGDTYPNGMKCGDRPCGAGALMEPEKNKLVGQGVPLAPLVRLLSQRLGGRIVVDNTGLKGTYDLTLQWAADGSPAAILTGTQEQLGLKLEWQKGPVEVLVIDHAEQPSEPQAQENTILPPVFAVATVELNRAGTSALKTGGIVSQRLNVGPGRFNAVNISMWELLRLAYRVEDYQVSGAPDWFSSDLYDVDAKAEKSAIDEMQKLGNDQREVQNRRMLQALLKDRFKLTLRQVNKDLPIYSLVVADAGKLQDAQGDCGPGPHTMELGTSSPPPCGSLRVFPWVGHLDGQKVPIKELLTKLSGFTRRMVLDKTNLGGKYDIDLKWFPDPSEFPPRPAYLPPTYQPDPNSPPLLTALQQELGLKLEPQTGPVLLLVIEQVEKPSGD